MFYAYAILVVSLSLLSTMLMAFPLGAAIFFSPSLGGSPAWTTPHEMSLSILGVFFEIRLPYPVSYSTLFLAFWTIHAAILAIALLYPHNLLTAIKDIGKKGVLALFDNSILAVSIVYPPLFLLISVLEKALEFGGVPVGQLPMVDPRTTFLGLLQASLTEELGFRATIIGIVAALIAYRLGGGLYGIKALWNPKLTLERLGLPVGKAKLNGIVVFSALIFGWAHIVYGESVWHLGKLLSATIAGLGLGYLFVFLGLPTVVLVHWSFNYYYATFYFLDKIRGLPSPSQLSLASATTLLGYSQEYIVILITLQSILIVTFSVLKLLSPKE